MDVLLRFIHGHRLDAFLEPRALAGVVLGRPPCGTVILAHGAGGHMNHPHILDLETLLVKVGFSVFRFNFPYTSQGRKFPDQMRVLVESYRIAVAEVLAIQEKNRANSFDRFDSFNGFGKRDTTKDSFSARIILAGHSMGGRVATLLAADGCPCAGLILFSYPLHSPGKPGQLRRDHLAKIVVPVLSLSGTRDSFCKPDLMQETISNLSADWTHHWLNHADHGLQVLKRSGRARQDILDEAKQVIESYRAKQAWN